MMDPHSAFPLDECFNEIVDISREYRWQAYQRLQELDIKCHYRAYHPLRVQIRQPIQAIQLWSIVQSLMMPRQASIQWLESCWNLRITQGR